MQLRSTSTRAFCVMLLDVMACRVPKTRTVRMSNSDSTLSYSLPQDTTGSDPNVEPNPSGGIAIVSVNVISYTPINATWPVVNFTLSYKLLPIQVRRPANRPWVSAALTNLPTRMHSLELVTC